MRRNSAIATIVLLLGMAALQLHRHPLSLPAFERERSADIPPAIAQAQALLIVDDAQVGREAQRMRWSRFDCSYAWWSALQEEFGATLCISPQAIRQGGIPGSAQMALLSSSAGGDAHLLSSLLAWVEAGHLLIVDALDESDARELGLRLSEAIPPTSALRSELGSEPWLAELPRLVELRALVELPASHRPILSVEGEPIAARLPWGDGALLLCGFDLGRWMHALRQGVVDEQLRPSISAATAEDESIRASDFRADPERVRAWSPRADLLLRAIVHAAQDWIAIPRISPMPAGSDGVFLFAGSGEGLVGGREFLQEIAARDTVTPTFFLARTPPSESSESHAPSASDEIGLQWDRAAPTGAWGLGKFRPFLRTSPLHEQWRAIRSQHVNPTQLLLANRNLDLLWGQDATNPLRILHANGFRIDSSYGPAGADFGWIFDSARPYHPLDRNGRPFALLELPFPYSSDSDPTAELQERLFADSQREYHAVIAPDLRARSMQRAPSAARMRLFLDQVPRARAHGHAVWSLGRYLRFRDERLASRVEREGDGYRILIAGDDLALELPRAAGWTQLFLDGQEQQISREDANGWHRLALARGEYLVLPGSRP